MSKKKNQAYYDRLLKEIHMDYVTNPKIHLAKLEEKKREEALKKERKNRNINKSFRKKRSKKRKNRDRLVPEEQISIILSKHNILYDREKTFKECYNPSTNYPLRFDFYIPSINTCIEYDGRQHFQFVKEIHGQKDRKTELIIQSQKDRDNIKNDFCRRSNIRLIRLNFRDYYHLEKRLSQLLNLDKIKENNIGQTISQG